MEKIKLFFCHFKTRRLHSNSIQIENALLYIKRNKLINNNNTNNGGVHGSKNTKPFTVMIYIYIIFLFTNKRLIIIVFKIRYLPTLLMI